MIVEYSQEFYFTAGHSGNDGEFCSTHYHNHDYIVRAEIFGEVNSESGRVIDDRGFGGFGDWIRATLHKSKLENELTCAPTPENLAAALLRELRLSLRGHYQGRYPHPLDIAVAVSQNPGSWATYREKW